MEVCRHVWLFPLVDSHLSKFCGSRFEWLLLHFRVKWGCIVLDQAVVMGIVLDDKNCVLWEYGVHKGRKTRSNVAVPPVLIPKKFYLNMRPKAMLDIPIILSIFQL